MLGLLGLMGALMAGFMVDAMMTRDPDDEAEDEDQAQPEAHLTQGFDDEDASDPFGLDETQPAERASASAFPPGDRDPSQDGHPESDDLPGPRDPDQKLSGGAGNDILTGEGGDDIIAGRAGNDLLGGRAGDDIISGGAGRDWLTGGDGEDRLLGGKGDDDLRGENGRDTILGGEGKDYLAGGFGADLLSGGSGDDTLVGGLGDDSLMAGTGHDAVQGGYGDDLAFGGEGSDTLDGDDGDDTLWGGRRNADDGTVDFLNGGAGDDLLHLGAGDYGNGGAGADTFELQDIAVGDPVAQITDFDPAEDRLVLLYDSQTHATPEVSIVTEEGSQDATVMLDGVPVARVLGGAGLSAADVTLKAA